jgi:hypothetical protein
LSASPPNGAGNQPDSDDDEDGSPEIRPSQLYPVDFRHHEQQAHNGYDNAAKQRTESTSMMLMVVLVFTVVVPMPPVRLLLLTRNKSSAAFDADASIINILSAAFSAVNHAVPSLITYFYEVLIRLLVAPNHQARKTSFRLSKNRKHI